MKSIFSFRVTFVGMVALVLAIDTATAGTSGAAVWADRNMVSQKDTAISIAKAVAEEAYGKGAVAGQLPLVAVLNNGVWHVAGTLPHGVPGGVVEVQISSRDGRILKIIHGK